MVAAGAADAKGAAAINKAKSGVVAAYAKACPTLDAWWDKLGYGEMSWWRHWERNWTEPAN